MPKKDKPTKPFKELGVALRAFRVAADETVQNVSDAVEIQDDRYSNIEEGAELPPQDVLELLISHFNLRDQEAARLWELAGYEFEQGKGTKEGVFMSTGDDDQKKKEIRIVVPPDSQILYTDMVQLMSNQYGVILNFIQGVGSGNQATVVARLGMSKEHAKSLLEVLQKNLES